MRSGGEDSKHNVDGMKSWPRSGMSGFGSELGCPVMQDMYSQGISALLGPGSGGRGGGLGVRQAFHPKRHRKA